MSIDQDQKLPRLNPNIIHKHSMILFMMKVLAEIYKMTYRVIQEQWEEYMKLCLLQAYFMSLILRAFICFCLQMYILGLFQMELCL